MVLSPITEINLTSTIKDDLFMGNNNLPAAIGKTQTSRPCQGKMQQERSSQDDCQGNNTQVLPNDWGD